VSAIWYPRWFPEYGRRETAHALKRDGIGQAVCDDRTWISAFTWPGFLLYDVLQRGAMPCAKCVLRLAAESREPLLELRMPRYPCC
jgi:hypothetical protein